MSLKTGVFFIEFHQNVIMFHFQFFQDVWDSCMFLQQPCRTLFPAVPRYFITQVFARITENLYLDIFADQY